MSRQLRVALLLLVATLAGTASAAWTVQVAAYQDYRQAQGQVRSLQELGFDAYTEFVTRGGTQFARVRVGCFDSEDSAAAFAADMQGNVTAEAVPQELTPGSGGIACVTWDPGFLKAASYTLVRTGMDVVYELELMGHRGYLQHDGRGWNFGPELPEAPGVTPRGRFESFNLGARSFVRESPPGQQPVVACSGTLVWQAHGVAVVERNQRVIACVVNRMDR
mgnify:FL=1